MSDRDKSLSAEYIIELFKKLITCINFAIYDTTPYEEL